MQHETLPIEVSKLKLIPDNPRFNTVNNQREAFMNMFKTKLNKDKLLLLTEDIANNGLNPGESIYAIPDKENDDYYYTVEGNRRLTALKILHDNDLIEGIVTPKEYKRIVQLSENPNIKIPQMINCVLFNSFDEAAPWIELKHTGQNKGKGVVPWDSIASERFKGKINNKVNVSVQLIDYFFDNDFFTEDEINEVVNIKITNLDRMIGTTYVREKLGLKISKGEFSFEEPAKESRQKVKDLIIHILDKDLTVSKLHNLTQRMAWIDKHFPTGPKTEKKPTNKDNSSDEKPQSGSTKGKSTDSNTNSNYPSSSDVKEPTTNNQNTKETKGSRKKDTLKRDKLIPSSFSVPIPVPRINRIFYELKAIKVKDRPNAVGVLYRVFIELSCDAFIERNELSPRKRELQSKITCICDYMIEEKIMNKEQIKPIKYMIDRPYSVYATNILNAYVHNMHLEPNPTDLKMAWDSTQLFIEKVWRN